MNWQYLLERLLSFLEHLKIGGSWWTTAIVWPLVLVAIVSLFRHRAQIRLFTVEVRAELAKASWPWDPKEKGFKRYKELVDSTMVVIIAMLLLSGYVAFLDFVLLNVVGFLTGGR